jgi:hypothetical protein
LLLCTCIPACCGRAQDEDEEDALDAFMAAEVLPEVTAAQAAERAAREQERLARAKAIAVRCWPSRPPLTAALCAGRQARVLHGQHRPQHRLHHDGHPEEGAEPDAVSSHLAVVLRQQEGKPATIPKLDKILDEDSDEETPDQELQIPAHKVAPPATPWLS